MKRRVQNYLCDNKMILDKQQDMKRLTWVQQFLWTHSNQASEENWNILVNYVLRFESRMVENNGKSPRHSFLRNVFQWLFASLHVAVYLTRNNYFWHFVQFLNIWKLVVDQVPLERQWWWHRWQSDGILSERAGFDSQDGFGFGGECCQSILTGRRAKSRDWVMKFK